MHQRIIALLLSLAVLAERAYAARPIRALLLWILRPGEAAARRFVFGLQQWVAVRLGMPSVASASPFQPDCGFHGLALDDFDSGSEAIWLANRFRALADELEALGPYILADGGLCSAECNNRLVSGFAELLSAVQTGGAVLNMIAGLRDMPWPLDVVAPDTS